MGGVFSYALTGNPTGTYTQIWQQLDDGDTNSQAISHTFGPQGLLDDIEIDPVTGHLYVLDYDRRPARRHQTRRATRASGGSATNGTGLTFIARRSTTPTRCGPSSICAQPRADADRLDPGDAGGHRGVQRAQFGRDRAGPAVHRARRHRPSRRASHADPAARRRDDLHLQQLPVGRDPPGHADDQRQPTSGTIAAGSPSPTMPRPAR